MFLIQVLTSLPATVFLAVWIRIISS